MIEGRSRACFATEAVQPVGVLCEAPRQDLQRYLATQPRVLRQINFAHPAAPDGARNLVRPDGLPHALGLTCSKDACRHLYRRMFQVISDLMMKAEKGFDLSLQ